MPMTVEEQQRALERAETFLVQHPRQVEHIGSAITALIDNGMSPRDLKAWLMDVADNAIEERG